MWDVRASFLPAIYIEGVTLAGGIATLLPPQPVDDAIAARVLDGLDGLIITGGRDVDPAAYGQTPHPTTDEPGSRDRDAWEFALLRGGAARGDCRCSGSAVARRCSTSRSAARCTSTCPTWSATPRHQAGNAVFSTSTITHGARHPAGRRSSASPPSAQCYHHQAIDRLGDGLSSAPRTADGVIEAVEIDPAAPGLLWSPCSGIPRRRLDDLRLFAGVVEAAADVCDEEE